MQALRERVARRQDAADPLRDVLRRLANRRTLATLDADRRRKVERLLRQIGELLDSA